MIKSPAVIGRKLAALGMANTPLDTLPVPLRRAVTLMLSGAAATVVWGLLQAVASYAYRNDGMLQNGKRFVPTGAQISATVGFDLLITIILAAAWVLMARKNQEGRGWARITASVLFLLWSLLTLLSIRSGFTVLLVAVFVVTFVIWVIGAVALFQLWRPASTAFYRSARGA